MCDLCPSFMSPKHNYKDSCNFIPRIKELKKIITTIFGIIKVMKLYITWKNKRQSLFEFDLIEFDFNDLTLIGVNCETAFSKNSPQSHRPNKLHHCIRMKH